MHLLFPKGEFILADFSPQPAEHIDIDKSGNNEDYQHYEEKYVRMSHLLIVRLWRVPLPLPN